MNGQRVVGRVLGADFHHEAQPTSIRIALGGSEDFLHLGRCVHNYNYASNTQSPPALCVCREIPRPRPMHFEDVIRSHH